MDWELWTLIALTLLGLLLSARNNSSASPNSASTRPPIRFSIASLMFWTALIALLLNLILDIPKTLELRQQRKDLEFRIEFFGPLVEHDRRLLDSRIIDMERDQELNDDVEQGLVEASQKLQRAEEETTGRE